MKLSETKKGNKTEHDIKRKKINTTNIMYEDQLILYEKRRRLATYLTSKIK